MKKKRGGGKACNYSHNSLWLNVQSSGIAIRVLVLPPCNITSSKSITISSVDGLYFLSATPAIVRIRLLAL
eukprot:m.38824 g.38824  ORF g.38824 m.38824 type:complete len:71 (-) comp6820_c0_seq1:546-758(-)